MTRTLFAGCAGLMLLSACANVPTVPEVARLLDPRPIETVAGRPPDAPPDTCWHAEVTPAKVDTVTEEIILQPAEVASDGTLLSQPIFKTETRETIVRERRELWFQTPCTHDMTPGFIASVQRALTVRGHMSGAATGEMDARTRRAIARYQGEQGLDSDTLSLAAAQRLGLVISPIAAQITDDMDSETTSAAVVEEDVFP